MTLCIVYMRILRMSRGSGITRPDADRASPWPPRRPPGRRRGPADLLELLPLDQDPVPPALDGPAPPRATLLPAVEGRPQIGHCPGDATTDPAKSARGPCGGRSGEELDSAWGIPLRSARIEIRGWSGTASVAAAGRAGQWRARLRYRALYRGPRGAPPARPSGMAFRERP
jgi:hypothetical protein